MTFLAPVFLFATLAGAVPVLLHLIHRQNARTVPFSTLRFLYLSVQRTRRRKYLEDIGLLLARVSLLVLLALGLSGPVLTAFRGQGAASAVAIVLDNSGSMTTTDDVLPRFDLAQERVHRILGRLTDRDAVGLFPTGGPPGSDLNQIFRTPEPVAQAVTHVQAGAERADLAATIRRAEEALRKEEAADRTVFVVTDNQALAWENAKSGEPPNKDAGPPIPLVVVDVHGPPRLNLALKSLAVSSPAPVVGAPVSVRAELVNVSDVAQEAHLALVLDGTRESVSATLELGPRGSVTHEFHVRPTAPGLHRGEVRLVETDACPADNVLAFAVTLDPRIPVAIVTERRHEIAYADDAFYLEQALGSSTADAGAFRVTRWTAAELASASLAGQAVVFCVNLPCPDTDTARRLIDYVEGGGHLVWTCGPAVDAQAYNARDAEHQGRLLPAALTTTRTPAADHPESGRLGTLDREHPALAPLAEPASLLRSVLVYTRMGIESAGRPEARVLARLDDGEALLVEHQQGAGSVLLLGTSVHADWTNLPLKPLFLPLLARLTFHLAGLGSEGRHATVGTPLEIPLEPPARGVAEIEIVRPDGEILRQHAPDAKDRTYRYEDTFAPGVYAIRQVDPPTTRSLTYAVQPDPLESAPAMLDRDAVEARFHGRTFRYCGPGDDLAGLVRELREGRPLGDGFLLIAIGLLVLEAFLAARRNPARAENISAANAPTAARENEPSVEEILVALRERSRRVS
jgi:hypothetical protein